MSLLSVWLASLVGSAHCVGMCGGWLTALELSQQSLWAYHGARLLLYMSLGALAASAGHALNRFGNATLWVVLAWLALQAFVQLTGRSLAGPWARFKNPLGFSSLRQLAPQQPVLRAALLGVATGFLPCGWLYSFVAIAATAPSPGMGALVMLVFGLGTLPALAVWSGALRLLLKKLETRYPRFRSQWVTAGLLVVTGVWVMVQHRSTHHHHHSHGGIEHERAHDEHEGHSSSP